MRMVGTPRCARPGCGGIATAWLSYDYAGQRVWLDDPGEEGAAGHHSALCATHAGRLRPPKGWSYQDRRSGPAAGSLLPPPRPAGPAPSEPRSGGEDRAAPPPAVAVDGRSVDGPGSEAAAGGPALDRATAFAV